MNVEELADRIKLVAAAVERVYGPHGGVAAEVKAAIIIAAAQSLAKEAA
jgi:hypothetical protein